MSISWERNRFLSEFSTFGIGGQIAYFAEIRSIDAMREAFGFVQEQKLPLLILGKGSNCLFDDAGFEGVVLLNKIDFCTWDDTKRQVLAGAGYSFSLLGTQSVKRGMGGLEFASGIPASVGGAVFMNAGANGFETAQTLLQVGYLFRDGKEKRFSREELVFGYRYSSFQTMQGAIIFAEFGLSHGVDSRVLQKKMIEHRRSSQPLQEKSAGCVFRNPVGQSAGAIIDACGLKGLQIGDAAVSEKHGNFIVNRGQSRAQEVRSLIEKIQEAVYKQTGVHLEPELRMIGKDGNISS